MKSIKQLQAAVEKARDDCTAAVSHANDMALASPKNARQLDMANAADKKAALMTQKFELAISELDAAQSA